MKKSVLSIFCSVFLFGFSQSVKPPLVSAIKASDLKRDMYDLAADQFLGRESGTLNELKAGAWLAQASFDAGMIPAGENGTFFQFFNLYRNVVAPQSVVKVSNKSLNLWDDVLLDNVVEASFEGDIVFVGNTEPENFHQFDMKDKVVAVEVSSKNISKNRSLFERLYPMFVKGKYYSVAEHLGAKGIIFITDDISDSAWDEIVPRMKRGTYGIENFRSKPSKEIPIFWIQKKNIQWVRGGHIQFNLIAETYTYPSVNVVGKIEGTDPQLKNEYVLISGHLDHDGVRNPVQNDTIYNGADDNASTCVAMLAMARAYKKQPARRSILFVFHGAEERGLLGSYWYSSHMTVAKKDVVAVLNGDMIGRNAIDQAALLGSNQVHKNSDDLVKMAMDANKESTNFKLLEQWDTAEHPEYFYFRSDHIPYVRIGIPSIFFTSTLHSQYHQPQDEAENIDFKKLYKMTEWIYRTSWKVANTPYRPKLTKE